MDWYCDASMSSKWVYTPPTIENIPVLQIQWRSDVGEVFRMVVALMNLKIFLLRIFPIKPNSLETQLPTSVDVVT